MVEEDKNLNIEETNEIKAPKLWAFSDSVRKKLGEMLSDEEIDLIEKKRLEKQKEQDNLIARKNKIIYLLNQEYSLSDELWFWENSEYKFYDEWDVIITSHEWNSHIFEFDWTKFAHNCSLPYRKIGKDWDRYIAILWSVDSMDKKITISTGIGSFISNKWVKLESIPWKIEPCDHFKGVYIRKYKIKNNYKVFAIYDKDLNLLVKHVPEWFRVLSQLNWEILFKKEQLDLQGEDFIVMHKWDNREEKRIWEYSLKDSPIYKEYIDSQNNKPKQ